MESASLRPISRTHSIMRFSFHTLIPDRRSPDHDRTRFRIVRGTVPTGSRGVRCLPAGGSRGQSFTDAAGCPALLRAAENGEEEMVRLLLGHGADIEARGPFEQSALSSCACNQVDRRKRSRTLRLLLASGADVNGRIDRGRTPLFSAATAGWAPEESVTILLEHGADPHIRNDDGRSVLEEVRCV